MMNKYSLKVCVLGGLLATVLGDAAVWAGDYSERTIKRHGIEALFGVTPTAGAVGDGRLTAQVTREGTLSCVRWPNATYWEHARYKTGLFNVDPALDGWRQPHYGAAPGDGVFAAATWVTASTTTRALREADTVTFRYASETSNRLVATYAFTGGPTIEETTFVLPTGRADRNDEPLEPGVLARVYRLTAAPAGAVVTLHALSNWAPRTDYGPPPDPRAQTESDGEPRVGALVWPAADALVDVQPAVGIDARRSEIAALRGEDDAAIDAWWTSQAASWPEGVYVAVGGSRASTRRYIGRDADGGEGAIPAWSALATTEVGRVATGAATGLLSFPLTDEAPVAWYAAFAASAGAAREALDAARILEPADWEENSDAWWADFVNASVLPDAADAREAAARALISLRAGWDPHSGAIVASTSCQPPYNLDWPRDGAFFQFAIELNAAGGHAEWREMARRHARFYRDLNARTRIYGPVGSFPMNTYADGGVGGPIDFEIDQVGLTMWTIAMHAAFDADDRDAYLDEMLPTLRRSEDLLLECRDEEGDPRLQCPANEDDNPPYVVTLHGALPTWLGLTAAAEVERYLGETARADALTARADEVAAGIRENFDPRKGDEDDGVLAGALGWSVWPGRFWRADETEVLAAIRARFTTELEHSLIVDRAGTSYDQKKTMALLMPPVRNDAAIATAAAAHRIYLDEVLTPDTRHLGEGTARDDFDEDGEPEWRNVTATPHIWAQTLLYLSLLAEGDPTLLETPAIPAAVRREANAVGCACTVTPGAPVRGAAGSALLVAMSMLVGWRRLRRRA